MIRNLLENGKYRYIIATKRPAENQPPIETKFLIVPSKSCAIRIMHLISKALTGSIPQNFKHYCQILTGRSVCPVKRSGALKPGYFPSDLFVGNYIYYVFRLPLYGFDTENPYLYLEGNFARLLPNSLGIQPYEAGDICEGMFLGYNNQLVSIESVTRMLDLLYYMLNEHLVDKGRRYVFPKTNLKRDIEAFVPAGTNEITIRQMG